MNNSSSYDNQNTNNNNSSYSDSDSNSNSESNSEFDSESNSEFDSENSRRVNTANNLSKLNKEILDKLVKKLNEAGYTKKTLLSVSKDEVKPFLIEIYQEYHTLAGFENSKKEEWRQASEEIIQEFNEKEEKNGNLLKYTILKNYPVTEIKNPSKLSEENQRCLICLEYFKKKDNSIILPCVHIFHSICIGKWVKNKHSCPVCKFKIEPIHH